MGQKLDFGEDREDRDKGGWEWREKEMEGRNLSRDKQTIECLILL